MLRLTGKRDPATNCVAVTLVSLTQAEKVAREAEVKERTGLTVSISSALRVDWERDAVRD